MPQADSECLLNTEHHFRGQGCEICVVWGRGCLLCWALWQEVVLTVPVDGVPSSESRDSVFGAQRQLTLFPELLGTEEDTDEADSSSTILIRLQISQVLFTASQAETQKTDPESVSHWNPDRQVLTLIQQPLAGCAQCP